MTATRKSVLFWRLISITAAALLMLLGLQAVWALQTYDEVRFTQWTLDKPGPYVAGSVIKLNNSFCMDPGTVATVERTLLSEMSRNYIGKLDLFGLPASRDLDGDGCIPESSVFVELPSNLRGEWRVQYHVSYEPQGFLNPVVVTLTNTSPPFEVVQPG